MGIRRRILRDFNKQQEDFPTLRSYNDYLEMVEDLIFNLSNNIDIIETNKKIQTYKEANKDVILKNRIKPTMESLELEDLLTAERKIREKVVKEQQVLDDLEKAARIRNKEKLIDDLMFGEESAEQILEQHRETVLREEKKIVFSNSGEENVRPHQIVNLIPDEPFVYEAPQMEFLGPVPPTTQELKNSDYIRNIQMRPRLSEPEDMWRPLAAYAQFRKPWPASTTFHLQSRFRTSRRLCLRRA